MATGKGMEEYSEQGVGEEALSPMRGPRSVHMLYAVCPLFRPVSF